MRKEGLWSFGGGILGLGWCVIVPSDVDELTCSQNRLLDLCGRNDLEMPPVVCEYATDARAMGWVEEALLPAPVPAPPPEPAPAPAPAPTLPPVLALAPAPVIQDASPGPSGESQDTQNIPPTSNGSNSAPSANPPAKKARTKRITARQVVFYYISFRIILVHARFLGHSSWTTGRRRTPTKTKRSLRISGRNFRRTIKRYVISSLLTVSGLTLRTIWVSRTKPARKNSYVT